MTLTRPAQYCNAVDKNGEGINNPAAHLACYRVREAIRIRPEVITTDQFGQQNLTVLKQRTQLCVPTTETSQAMSVSAAPAPSSDHFEMYKVKTTTGTPKFERLQVSVEDQWVDETVELKKPVRLGVPTDKNSEGILDVDSHLTCYSLNAQKFDKRDVDIQNQFGQFSLTVKRPEMLCVPSNKQVVSGG